MTTAGLFQTEHFAVHVAAFVTRTEEEKGKQCTSRSVVKLAVITQQVLPCVHFKIKALPVNIFQSNITLLLMWFSHI